MPETSNLRAVCDTHAPKPQEKFTKKEPKFFIGKWVKKAFKVNKEFPKRPQLEHIWVKVTEVRDRTLVGTLANAPLFMEERFGDKVTVELSEIEDLSTTAD